MTGWQSIVKCWKRGEGTPVITSQNAMDFRNLVMDILEDAGELKERVPYEKLVTTELSEKAAKAEKAVKNRESQTIVLIKTVTGTTIHIGMNIKQTMNY